MPGIGIKEFFPQIQRNPPPDTIKRDRSSPKAEKPWKKTRLTPFVLSNTSTQHAIKLKTLMLEMSRLLDSKFSLFIEEIKPFF